MSQTAMDTVKSYLYLIHKRNTLFVSAAIIITTIIAAACYVIPEKYAAQSMVFIESNVIGDLVSGIAVTPSMEDRLDVLLYSMKSRSLLLKVIDALDLDLSMARQGNMEGLIKKLQEDTTIKIEGEKNRSREGMNLFTVSFRHHDPLIARDYVNTLVKMYIEENLSEKRAEARGANRFLGDQIEYFRKKLEDIEKEIVQFRTEKGVFVSVDERKVVDEIKGAEEELEELQIRRMELQAKSATLRSEMEKERPYTAAFIGSASGSPRERIAALQKKLSELLLNYTEHYPEVIAVKAEIMSLNEQLERGTAGDEPAGAELNALNPLYHELKETLSNISSDIAALDVRERYLKKIIVSKKAYLREIPAEKKKLSELEREKESNMKIYEELILRLGQSEVSSQMEIQDKGATFRIVDPAVTPTVPVSPNRMKILLMAILAGIAGGFGIVLLRENMDKSVRSVEVLKQLNVPILGMIPEILIPEVVMRKRKRDIRIYTVGACCTMVVLGLLVWEVVSRRLGL